MPWYLYIALKHLFPTGRRITLFSVLSIVGIALGVGVLYIAMSIMNGMQHEIRENLRSSGGDIRIVKSGDFISDWQSDIQKLEKLPQVEAVNPTIEGIVMMVHDGKPAFPVIVGLDVNARKQVIPFEEKDFLKRGSMDDLYDESVFVGAGLARDIGISVGEVLDVYTPLIAEKLKTNDLILPRELTVAGIYETGWGKVDKNTLVVTLRTMQDFYGLGEDVHGMLVRCKHNADVDRVAANIEKTLGHEYRALTWLDQNGDFLNILAMEKGMIFIVTVFIILVASFSIVVTLFSFVATKTREIGLLGALGATPTGIAIIFAFQSMVIFSGGTLLGLLFALLILSNLSPILRFGLQLFGAEDAIWRFYEFYTFPVYHSRFDLIAIVVTTFVLAVLAGIIPALRAACMKPSEALRYE